MRGRKVGEEGGKEKEGEKEQIIVNEIRKDEEGREMRGSQTLRQTHHKESGSSWKDDHQV